MESDAQKKLDVMRSEEMEIAGNLQESLGAESVEPWDGSFYVEGDDEPLIVKPNHTTLGELERMLDDVEDKNQMVEELLEWVSIRTKGDVDLAATLMKKGLRRLNNKNKQKDPCRIIVKENGIFVEFPDQKLKKVTFGRGNLSKTLYVFFLRQIMRAKKDNTISGCLSQFEMGDYKEELMFIYQNVSGKHGDIHEVESWLEKGTVSNNFANATASVRKYFDKLFDNYVIKYKWEKCYSIEIMGTDRRGNPRYGIKLTPDDFVLNWPFEV